MPRPQNRFCTRCGTPLDAGATPPPPVRPSPNRPSPNRTPTAQRNSAPRSPAPPAASAATGSAATGSPAAGSPAAGSPAAVALALGLLVPGGGQAYNGQPLKACILFFASSLVLPWFYSLWDAWSTARRPGAESRRGGCLWVGLQLWLALDALLIALLGLTLYGVLS